MQPIRSALAALALASLVPTLAQAAVVFDGTFIPADWTTIDQSFGTNVTVSTNTAQSATGGNPDFSRQITWDVGPRETGSFGAIVTLNILNTFSYDPSASGAIQSLAVSFDVRNLRMAGESSALAYRGLLKQGGQYYATGGVFADINALTSFDFDVPNEADWDLVGPAEGTPDFSATGAAINFGYRIGVGYFCDVCPRPEVSGVDALDNFRVSVNEIPEPTTPALLALALAAVATTRVLRGR